MRARRIGGWILIVALLASTLSACGGASGASIEVEDAWARPALSIRDRDRVSGGGAGQRNGQTGTGAGQSMEQTGTGAVFMQLRNKGDEADRLVGGETDVAQVVEIHETVMKGEMMKMQMLAGGLEVPAKGEVTLKPGGYHIMLIGIQRDLEVDDTFTLKLEFEKSGTITVKPKVRQP
jgi:copper(I)-binding protein